MRREEPQVSFEPALELTPATGLLSQARRAQARERFERATLGKSEAWWYTPLGKRLSPQYALRDAVAPQLETKGAVSVLTFAEASALIDTPVEGAEGARQTAIRASELLGSLATEEGEAYCALNTAHVERGLIIYAHSTEGEAPSVRVTWPVTAGEASEASSSPTATISRTLIICEEGARLSVTERFVSPEGELISSALSAHVTELWVGARAQLTYLRAQTTALTHHHVGRISASVQERGQLTGTLLNLGGALSRVEVEASLEGERADVTLNGAFTGSATQLLDQHLTLRHMSPNCTSAQRFKGLIGGSARGIFTGRVYVAEGASGTRAEQNNPNLILTEGARAMTRPQLEIYNDDVECSHGATVGQLDERALFYLRSRGLTQAVAERLLAEAFVGEVLSEVRDEQVVAEAQEAIQRALKTLESLES